MKLVSPFSCLALALLVCLLPVNGQMNVPCSASMLSSFTPCLNFVTNSSVNGTSGPTPDCCNAIQSLASGSRDCLCFIVTGRAPFQISINRTLAISLPRACNLPGMPLQCNAATAPVPAPAPAPAPGPISPGPTSFPPQASPSASPQAPESATPALTPASKAPSSPVVPDAEAPTATAGSRPVLTPSSAVPSNTFPSFLLLGFTFAIFKFN